jgi:DUF177 domain-containing protein
VLGGPVFITLAELEHHRIVVSKSYASGMLDYPQEDLQQAGPLDVEAVAELVGEEIRIRGHIRVRLSARCDRCLGPVEIPVDRDFDLTYRPVETIAREEEIEVPEDELGVGFFSGDGVALAEVVTEQVILAVPMKSLCRDDCRGLCPICGADRNRVECNCPSRSEESPFARLMHEEEKEGGSRS